MLKSSILQNRISISNNEHSRRSQNIDIIKDILKSNEFARRMNMIFDQIIIE